MMTLLKYVAEYAILGFAVIGLFKWWADDRDILSFLGFALLWPLIVICLAAMMVYDLFNKEEDTWD